VDWRFISLRLINSHIDYDAHFPPEYEAGHTAGLRLLRVAVVTRDATAPEDSVGSPPVPSSGLKTAGKFYGFATADDLAVKQRSALPRSSRVGRRGLDLRKAERVTSPTSRARCGAL
jgi:hypothetical protein